MKSRQSNKYRLGALLLMAALLTAGGTAAAKNEPYFGKIQPTRTTVGVDSLPTPIAVELKIIASVSA